MHSPLVTIMSGAKEALSQSDTNNGRPTKASRSLPDKLPIKKPAKAQPVPQNIAREVQELKTALAPLLDPNHKSGIPMRIQYAPKPDNTENVQPQSQGEAK